MFPNFGNVYDKVKLWSAINPTTPNISQFLSNVKEQIDHETGETSFFGSINGLKISVYPNRLSIIGSLSKVLYHNNIYSLDRKSTAKAIEKLSDLLHVDMKEAKVTEFEFGTQFIMQYPIECYLSKLGEMPKLIRYCFNKNTLYYQTRGKQSNKTFIFYDKKADAITKKMLLPAGFEKVNLLKYEMRLKGRLSKQLGVPEVKALTLYDNTFYKRLMDMYKNSYFSISKKQDSYNPDLSCITTVSDAFKIFIARCINQQETGLISDFIAELKANDTFKDRKNYSRLKKKLGELTCKTTTDKKNKYIQELDDAIINISTYV